MHLIGGRTLYFSVIKISLFIRDVSPIIANAASHPADVKHLHLELFRSDKSGFAR